MVRMVWQWCGSGENGDKVCHCLSRERQQRESGNGDNRVAKVWRWCEWWQWWAIVSQQRDPRETMAKVWQWWEWSQWCAVVSLCVSLMCAIMSLCAGISHIRWPLYVSRRDTNIEETQRSTEVHIRWPLYVSIYVPSCLPCAIAANVCRCLSVCRWLPLRLKKRRRREVLHKKSASRKVAKCCTRKVLF